MSELLGIRVAKILRLIHDGKGVLDSIYFFSFSILFVYSDFIIAQSNNNDDETDVNSFDCATNLPILITKVIQYLTENDNNFAVN